MRKSIVTVLAALTAFGLGASPALAAEEQASVSVTYGDLDLTAPAGNAALETRIEAAVEKVCAKPDLRNLKATIAWEECKTTARLDAMEQLSIASPYEGVELTSIF